MVFGEGCVSDDRSIVFGGGLRFAFRSLGFFAFPVRISTCNCILRFGREEDVLLKDRKRFIVFFLLPASFSFPVSDLLCSTSYCSIEECGFFQRERSGLFPKGGASYGSELLRGILRFIFSRWFIA